MVASSVAALQSLRADAELPYLTPIEMRTLLIETGIPQSNPQDGHVGPFPDLGKAILALDIGAADCNENHVPDLCEDALPGAV